MTNESITSDALKNHDFLSGMLRDDYFPNHLVLEGVDILKNLCIEIEREKPGGLEDLYVLTHRATEKFNRLDQKLQENDSEIETMAREWIAEEFWLIAESYGFSADEEDLIAPRDW